jgi:hypothetical protein
MNGVCSMDGTYEKSVRNFGKEICKETHFGDLDQIG